MSSSSDSPSVMNGVSSSAASSSGPTKGRPHVPNGVAVPNGLIRRSNRRQKVRGEKEIIVSSDMLLRELRVKVGSFLGAVVCFGGCFHQKISPQIMELFKIAPFDQILRMESSSGASSILLRADNVKTLGELKVLPRSLIYLRADDMAVGCDHNGTGASNGLARAGSGDGEPWSLNHHPEEGFKGELEVFTKIVEEGRRKDSITGCWVRKSYSFKIRLQAQDCSADFKARTRSLSSQPELKISVSCLYEVVIP